MRDPDYQIVLLLPAKNPEVAKGLTSVQDLCIGTDAVDPPRPPRLDWRNSTLYVATFLSEFITAHRGLANDVNEALIKADEAFGTNSYGEPHVVYCDLGGDTAIAKRVSYAAKSQVINTMEAKERELYGTWVTNMRAQSANDSSNGVFMEQKYGYGKRIGIREVQLRIHNLWFRSFIQRLPLLYNQLYARGQLLLVDYFKYQNTVDDNSRYRQNADMMAAYVTAYVYQMCCIYDLSESDIKMIYKREHQTWTQELVESLRVALPDGYCDWGLLGHASTPSKLLSKAQSHTEYAAFASELRTPMLGANQIERAIRLLAVPRLAVSA